MKEQSDEKYRLLYESSSEAIMILIPNERFIACNPATVQLFACKNEEEFISKTPAELSPEYQPDKQLSREKAAKMMSIAMEKGKNIFEWTHKRLNGEEFAAIVTLTRMQWGGRDVLQSIVKDISVLKNTEKKLNEAKEYLELVLNLIPSAVYTLDMSRRITSFNKKAEEITGYTADEMIGKECRVFAESPCRDFCGLFSDEVKKPVIGKECTIIRKDGQRRFVYKNADLIRDAQGRVIAGIESFEDITERRRIEKEKAELFFERAERVKELNCLYGISKIVEEPNITLEEILQSVVDIMPPAFQFPDNVRVRIIFESKEFKTSGFKEGEWKQSADIKAHGDKIGVMEIFYTGEKPAGAERTFSKEEEDLINAVVERLGRIIERHNFEISLKKSYDELENKVKERTKELRENLD
ncbi:MAG: PAS domain S-box protein, partial [Candidatus Omnitrophota bacterium]